MKPTGNTNNTPPKVTIELVQSRYGAELREFKISIDGRWIPNEILGDILGDRYKNKKYRPTTDEICEIFVADKDYSEKIDLLSRLFLSKRKQLFESIGCEVEVVLPWDPVDEIQLEHGYTRLANKLIERRVRVRLTGYEGAVWLTIVRETYGWAGKKKSKEQIWRVIKTDKIIEITGIPRREVKRTIKNLLDKNMIEQRKTKIKTEAGLREVNQFRIQKDSRLWKCSYWGVNSPTQRKSKSQEPKEKPASGLKGQLTHPKCSEVCGVSTEPPELTNSPTPSIAESIDSQRKGGTLKKYLNKDNNIASHSSKDELDKSSSNSNTLYGGDGKPSPDHSSFGGVHTPPSGENDYKDFTQVDEEKEVTTSRQTHIAEEGSTADLPPRPEPTSSNPASGGAFPYRGKAKKGKGNPQVREFLLEFARLFEEKTGDPFHIVWDRHGGMVKPLFRTFDLDTLKRKARSFFNTKWVEKYTYSLDLFVKRINDWAQRDLREETSLSSDLSDEYNPAKRWN